MGFQQGPRGFLQHRAGSFRSGQAKIRHTADSRVPVAWDAYDSVVTDEAGTIGDIAVPQSPARPARLHPFRALRLAPDQVADPGALRPMSRPYRQALRRLAEWEQQGRLARDPEPALHLHEYTVQGITVRGLVGALDLSTRGTSLSDRAVLPHEAIHPDQADDLARRMSELALNPAPILLVHRGTAQSRALLSTIASGAPDHELTDRTGQHHRQWRITDPDQVALLGRDSLDRLLLADGHHRFEAYLRLQQQHPGTGWDHGLAMVVDHDDTPLFLGPIHRILSGVSLDEVCAAAEAAGGKVVPRDREHAVAVLGPGTWVLTDGRRWHTVEHDCTGGPDVAHLHEDVLARLAVRGTLTVGYRHSVEEALVEVQRSTALAVLLPAPHLEQLEHATTAGRLLPEKATSFQPKPSFGVFMRAVPE
ncbi:DUF1015 family protein [Nocardioides campestrisoli]|uniref:DUF1015 family protein n=1 Tax=Nocardioides campestrisoli TaxID=2736757 RepID=UPI00359C9AAC